MTKAIASLGLAVAIFGTALTVANMHATEQWTGLQFLSAAWMISALAYALFAYKEE